MLYGSSQSKASQKVALQDLEMITGRMTHSVLACTKIGLYYYYYALACTNIIIIMLLHCATMQSDESISPIGSDESVMMTSNCSECLSMNLTPSSMCKVSLGDE